MLEKPVLRTHITRALFILATFGVSADVYAEEQKQPDLRFMSGQWSSQAELGVFKYSLYWTENERGNMTGCWRGTGSYAARASINVELLVVERDNDGFNLKVKHFNTQWQKSSAVRLSEVEDKNEWQVCRLSGSAHNEAVFDNGRSDGQKLRITYRKIGKRLEVTRETIENGKPVLFSLTYKRD